MALKPINQGKPFDKTSILKSEDLNAIVENTESLETGKAEKSHVHNASEINAGILSAARGGTGQTSLQATRNAMGLGNTTGVLPVENGGTGTNYGSSNQVFMGLEDHRPGFGFLSGKQMGMTSVSDIGGSNKNGIYRLDNFGTVYFYFSAMSNRQWQYSLDGTNWKNMGTSCAIIQGVIKTHQNSGFTVMCSTSTGSSSSDVLESNMQGVIYFKIVGMQTHGFIMGTNGYISIT